jgi:hypothetical protein
MLLRLLNFLIEVHLLLIRGMRSVNNVYKWLGLMRKENENRLP